MPYKDSAKKRESDKEYMRRKRAKDPEMGKRAYAQSPEYFREYRLMKSFGLTIKEYETLYEAQQGVCAICYRPERVAQRRLAVDHCHSTGTVRGLLCWDCNSSLGKFEDNPDRLRRAAQYVEQYATVEES